MMNMSKPISALQRGITVFCIVSLISVGLSFAIANAQPFAYVTNLGSNTVSVIDTASNTVMATVVVGIGRGGGYPSSSGHHPGWSVRICGE
jgi:YVTN family beta-propeller protein